jgi:hypothetical protein
MVHLSSFINIIDTGAGCYDKKIQKQMRRGEKSLHRFDD